MTTPADPAGTLRAAVELLSDAESYLSALHGSVARHDNLGANLTCGGCQLRDRITPALVVARQVLGTAGGPAAVAEEQEPIPLRWGLDDVMYGDDDTTVVMLSGPSREPYWVELDPERTDALRNALAGPEPEAAPTVDLRDRIAKVLAGTELKPPFQHCLTMADAVLAVLPAAADRAAILRERANYFEGVRNAANPGSDPRYWSAISDVVMGLRHLADEAQQPETEAHEHTWVTVPAAGAYAQLIGHTWTRCGICGQTQQPAADQPDTETEEPAV